MVFSDNICANNGAWLRKASWAQTYLAFLKHWLLSVSVVLVVLTFLVLCYMADMDDIFAS